MGLINLDIISTVVQRSVTGRPVPTGNTIIMQNGADIANIIDKITADLRGKYLSKTIDDEALGMIDFKPGLKIGGIELKYDEENNAVYIERTDGNPVNFYATGGLSMYGLGNTKVTSIMDAIEANIDPNTLGIVNGKLTVIGGGGSGGEGGITAVTKQMVIEALGFTPYSAENPNGYITAASIPSALKNPYALTFGSKTYDGSSAKSITASDLGAALSSDLSKYLPLSGGEISSSNQAPLSINSTSDNTRSFIIFKHNGVNKAFIGYTISNGAYIENPTTGKRLRILDNLLYNDNTVWHSGNLTPSDYLQKSGGIVSNATTTPLTINSTITEANLQVSVGGSGKALFGYKTGVGVWMRDSKAYNLVIGDDGILKYGLNNTLNTVWHAGNDGSGSGLDADLLDGFHAKGTGLSNLFKWGSSASGNLGGVWCKLASWSATTTDTNTDVGFLLHSSFSNVYAHIICRVRKGEYAYLYAVWAYGIDASNIKLCYDDSISNFELWYYGGKAYSVVTAELLYESNRNGSRVDAVTMYSNNQGTPSLSNSASLTRLTLQNNVASATKLSDDTSFTIWGQEFFVNGKPKSVNGAFRLLCDIPSTVVIHKALVYPTSPYGLITRAYINGDISLQVQRENKDSECFNLLLNPLGGNVGINTPNPSAKLHVNGTSYLGGATTIGGNLVPSASNTYALGAYNNNWSYIYTTGIRRWDGSTANETPLLHGESNNTNITLLRVSYASSSYFAQTGAYGFTLKYFGVGGGNANYLKLLADNQTASSQVLALCVDQAGNIGVGCDTNEDYKLRVNGTGYFSSNLLVGGGVTMQSQRSLKNVVDERGLSLTELSAIKPTRYTWKDGRDNNIHFGGIADDIEKVLPEVIYKTADGTLTMDYGNAGFAIASSLIKPVIDHETKIRMLEIRVKELEEELKRYSA